MDTIITIDGTPYDMAARAAARMNAIDSLTKSLDGAPDEVAFTLSGVGPNPPFDHDQTVDVEIDTVLQFSGNISAFQWTQSTFGWQISIRAQGLKRRGDYLTIRGSDGSGQAVYNRPPGDTLYVSSDAGLTVGEIVHRVLEIEDNAAALDAIGIGDYGGAKPPYTLPAATLADLALLDIVPPRSVTLSGEGIINQIEAFIQQWHQKYVLNIQPDGTIRIRNLFGFTSYPLVIQGESGAGDVVKWPNITADSEGVYTRVRARGVDIQAATLSLLEGTLIRAWSGGDESSWTYSDFDQPKDGYDVGVITALTTTQATVDPDNNLHAWAANFWSSNQGHITLNYAAGVGIDMKENRRVTSCSSLTAGGTGTITWDASVPLPHLLFDTYTLVATAGSLIEVGRLFYVREPSGPLTGTSTFIGPRLVPALPYPMAWANTGRLGAATGAVGGIATGPTGFTLYSPTGSMADAYSMAVNFEVVPSLGAIRLFEPDVKAWASISRLRQGYPTTYAEGKILDLVVLVPYNRGGLEVVVPTSGWEGTAYDDHAMERELLIDLPDWTYAGDTANVTKLCQEHLDVCKDIVYDGSIVHRGLPAGFDPLDMGYAISMTVSGLGSPPPWSGVDLPVRSVTLTWPQGSGTTHEFRFNFSNRRRPFSGDDLYLHPAPMAQMGMGGQNPFGDAGIPGIGQFNMQAVGGQADGPGFMPNYSAPPALTNKQVGQNKENAAYEKLVGFTPTPPGAEPDRTMEFK